MPEIRLPPKLDVSMRELIDRLPPGRAAKIKLLAASVILAVCLPFLLFRVLSSIDFAGPVAQPATPAEVKSREVSTKLVQDIRFRDVALVAVTEEPMRFRVVGALHKEADRAALQQFLGDLLPSHDLEYDILILPE